MSIELSTRIAELRQKALTQELTDDELREALAALRQDRRFAAASASAKKRTERAAAIPVDAEALLQQFQ